MSSNAVWFVLAAEDPTPLLESVGFWVTAIVGIGALWLAYLGLWKRQTRHNLVHTLGTELVNVRDCIKLLREPIEGDFPTREGVLKERWNAVSTAMSSMKAGLRACEATKWGEPVTSIVSPVRDAFTEFGNEYSSLMSNIELNRGSSNNNARSLELDTHIDLLVRDDEKKLLERFEQAIDEARTKLKKYL